MGVSESAKQKAGGISYEVILAPANAEAAPPQAGSPPKERPISGEFIQQKLKEAEERRAVGSFSTQGHCLGSWSHRGPMARHTDRHNLYNNPATMVILKGIMRCKSSLKRPFWALVVTFFLISKLLLMSGLWSYKHVWYTKTNISKYCKSLKFGTGFISRMNCFHEIKYPHEYFGSALQQCNKCKIHKIKFQQNNVHG